MKYFCIGDIGNVSRDLWRFGGVASLVIHNKGLDENGVLQINLVKGVDKFKNKVLLLYGDSNTLIGAEYKKE